MNKHYDNIYSTGKGRVGSTMSQGIKGVSNILLIPDLQVQFEIKKKNTELTYRKRLYLEETEAD